MYGYGGPSEKKCLLINFLLQNTNLVSVLLLGQNGTNLRWPQL